MKRKRGGENVGWHRIVDNLDDALRKLAASPDVGILLLRRAAQKLQTFWMEMGQYLSCL
jgi:hypothetical protein